MPFSDSVRHLSDGFPFDDGQAAHTFPPPFLPHCSSLVGRPRDAHQR
jgi:hypothetical protein